MGWGLGYFGEMGDGTHTSSNRAVQVPGLSGVSAIAAGGDHNLALQTDGGRTGVVWAWGRNNGAQLGDGSTTDRLRPIVIATDVVQVVAGADQTILVKSDGTIWGAGFNQHGELGDTTLVTPRLTLGPALVGVPPPRRSAPVEPTPWPSPRGRVSGERGRTTSARSATAAARIVHPCARRRSAARARCRGLALVVQHLHGTAAHSVALTDDGRVWTWGSNWDGQLGTGGGPNDSSYVPRPVAGFSAADQTWPLGDPDGDGLLTGEEIAGRVRPLQRRHQRRRDLGSRRRPLGSERHESRHGRRRRRRTSSSAPRGPIPCVPTPTGTA